jgi:hypothetical protein
METRERDRPEQSAVNASRAELPGELPAWLEAEILRALDETLVRAGLARSSPHASGSGSERAGGRRP